jgi:hypothetical protein
VCYKSDRTPPYGKITIFCPKRYFRLIVPSESTILPLFKKAKYASHGRSLRKSFTAVLVRRGCPLSLAMHWWGVKLVRFMVEVYSEMYIQAYNQYEK